MALTPTERKRQQLQRDYERLRQMPDSTYPFLTTPFYKHLETAGDTSNYELNFDLMGIAAPTFGDDRGPADFANDDAFGSDEDKAATFAGRERSIGRAEVMVGQLLDAAFEMASIINDYKRRELNRALAKIEAQDLSDPTTRKAALQDVVHINQLLEELKKNVRRSLPQWEVKVHRRE